MLSQHVSPLPGAQKDPNKPFTLAGQPFFFEPLPNNLSLLCKTTEYAAKSS